MERAERKYRGWGGKERDATNRYQKGTGPPVEAGRGGGAVVRVMEAVRRRKGPFDIRNIGLTWTWAQIKEIKWGQPDGGREERLARGTLLYRQV